MHDSDTHHAFTSHNNKKEENNMKLINLTPHALRLRIDELNDAIPLESDIVLQPAGPAARVDQRSIITGYVNAFPIKRTVFQEIYDLPNPEEGVVYIVSMLVAQQAKRDDVMSPNTAPGQDIRYPADHKLKGLTFAVRGFQQF